MWAAERQRESVPERYSVGRARVMAGERLLVLQRKWTCLASAGRMDLHAGYAGAGGLPQA